MIGPLVAAGYRVVTPDHIGFGRSDKPTERASYSYGKLVGWLGEFVRALDLTRITLICRVGAGRSVCACFRKCPIASRRWRSPTLCCRPARPPKGVAGWPGPIIEAWAETCRTSDDLPISEIIAAVCVERPDAAVLAAYDAPFPDASFKAGTLQITCCIPLDDSYPGVAENKVAWDVLERFDRPLVTLFSDSDPSTIAWEEVFQRRVPGAAGQPHSRIERAGHFLREEQGEAMAERLVKWRGPA